MPTTNSRRFPTGNPKVPPDTLQVLSPADRPILVYGAQSDSSSQRLVYHHCAHAMSCRISSQVGSPIHCDSSTLSSQDSSVGSLGHPELCHKPCLFLKYGTCPRGSACGYCHGQHKCKRKKHNVDLQLLGEANTLALILPHLLNKQLPADKLIYLLDQQLASMPAPAAVVSVHTKQLNRQID